MPLKLSDLEIETRLPALPPSLPVYVLAAPTLEERRGSLGRLAEQMKLGSLRSVELEHGLVMASPQGDITFFHASGAGVGARCHGDARRHRRAPQVGGPARVQCRRAADDAQSRRLQEARSRRRGKCSSRSG